MPNDTKEENILTKVLYWGAARSGKTTIVDSLYHLTKEKYTDNYEPEGELKKIAKKDGATLYFDRGVFRSKKERRHQYHVYTVAGQVNFAPIRKKIFQGTDAVVFVFDAQPSRLQANIDSLKELKNVSERNLIKEIPLLVMVNKQDLPEAYRKPAVEEILAGEGLFFPPDDPWSLWNPIVYETIALYDIQQNIYPVFAELIRRLTIYKTFGDGVNPPFQK
ncbi:MAG: ADP-ribosylation factor-like protein [Promethearchaeota archaeon]